VLGVLTLMNILVAPLIFYLSRNILNNPEWGNS
jgi:hypothetical protein